MKDVVAKNVTLVEFLRSYHCHWYIATTCIY